MGIVARTVFFLLVVAILPTYLYGEGSDPLFDECQSKVEFKLTCDGISPTDHCSKPLTDLCCKCQSSWQIEYAICSFNPNLLATPTPTPEPTPNPTETPTVEATPTATPTLVGGGEIPDASECLNGVDSNFDGVVDGTTTPCLYVPGCKKQELEVAKEEIEFDAGKLEQLSWQSYKLLKKAPKQVSKVNKSLAERLKESGKNVIKKLPKRIAAAKLSLELISNIPSEFVVCDSDAVCTKEDHGSKITSYIAAVINLRALATRSLRRATRLIEDDVKVAAKKTRKLGKDVRKQANKLIDQAELLPKVQSVCEG